MCYWVGKRGYRLRLFSFYVYVYVYVCSRLLLLPIESPGDLTKDDIVDDLEWSDTINAFQARGHSRSLKLVQFETLGTEYGFLFAFRSNYCSILYHFPDKAIYWSKIEICHTPLAHDTPVTGVPSEGCYAVWYGKTSTVWLFHGWKKVWQYI